MGCLWGAPWLLAAHWSGVWLNIWYPTLSSGAQGEQRGPCTPQMRAKQGPKKQDTQSAQSWL